MHRLAPPISMRAPPPRRRPPLGVAWWAIEVAEVARGLDTDGAGLTAAEAEARLRRYGPNTLQAKAAVTRRAVLWRQLRNPLLLLLVFAAAASLATAAWIDAAIVTVIFGASTAFGYAREYAAERSAEVLSARVQLHATAIRDGAPRPVPTHALVPGDLVVLSAGSIVPADLRVVSASDCFVNEAALTGESFPAEKRPAPVAAEARLADRASAAYRGCDVRSGSATGLVVATGTASELGAIAHRLAEARPETEFQRSLRHFGYLLTTTMLVVALAVFAINVILGRPPITTLLFAIALAVGLSPELLPAIVSINLARGAQLMARHGVLVRRLEAIENLGSMDVLCTDKTGTLTAGDVALAGAFDADGAPAPAVGALAYTNAALQAGFTNPLDAAILAGGGAADQPAKVTELPYDFARKRLSVAVATAGGVRLICKGAFDAVLACCTRGADGAALDDAARAALRGRYQAWAAVGTRVIAVATRDLPAGAPIDRAAEAELTFAGFLTFTDHPKPGAAPAIAALVALGVTVKIISGDSALVTRHVAGAVGLDPRRLLTGHDVAALDPDGLTRAVEQADLFAEVDPDQKLRVIAALRRAGHVVGFLGDGINDAPAMHAADTSLSVEGAVDVARAAADFVLLEADLDVIRRGVEAGRRTFANTLKYVLTTMSANLGNMISMAAASLLLPFLPMLAGQILLNNLLSDIPAIGLADDAVDPELVAQPRRWHMGFILGFMLRFGALSSLFDAFTFGLLWYGFAAGPALFRTGWFIESLLTELAIALVVRTHRPLYRSRPGRVLLWSTLALIPLTCAIPYLPGASLLGFVAPPARLVAALVGITLAYVGAAELLKRRGRGLSPR
ncbi:MAG: magnesium-translocating P-type ATPase [Kofleriaceae bacterium]|nr:magnesium-translocating P-type ATPase [Kofleriaceae bacterium]